MRRREFLSLAGATGAALALPHVARAQAKVPRVALISAAIATDQMYLGKDVNWGALVGQMEADGFVEGKTVIYDRYLMPAASPSVADENARKILAANPNAMFFGGAPTTAFAVMALDKQTPIVIENTDLFAQGFVRNLAHPEANVTGVSVSAGPDTEGKVLSLLAEAVPAAKTVAYANSGTDGQFLPVVQGGANAARAASERLGLTLIPVIYPAGGGEAAFAKVFGTIAAAKADIAMFGNNTALTATAQQQLVATSAQVAHLPTIAADGGYAIAGGLLSYGPNYPALARQCGDYIAAVLHGTKPGDMPVLQPTLFDLIVNQKTAHSIGITIPQSVLIQATQVIE